MGAIGGNDEDATGAGGEDVPRGVDLEPVGKPLLSFLEELRAVEEGLAGIERAVGLDVEHLPDRRLGIGLGHIETLLIGGKADAVGTGHRVAQERYRAVGGDPVDATEVEFAALVVEALGEAVGGVGEVDRAGGVNGDVVGAVEPLPLVVVGDGPLAPAGREPADAAVAMLAGDEVALTVEREAVAAALVAVGAGAGEAGRLEVGRQPFPLLPAIDPVAGDVAEQDGAVSLHPHRTLRPLEATGEDLDDGSLRHEAVEARVEPLDRTEGGEEIGRAPLLGTSGGDGQEEREAQQRQAAHDGFLRGRRRRGPRRIAATTTPPRLAAVYPITPAPP